MSPTAIQERQTQAQACPHCVPNRDPNLDLRCASRACQARARGAGYLPDDSRVRDRTADYDDDAPRRAPWALGSDAYRARAAQAATSRLARARTGRVLSSPATGGRLAVLE